MSGKKRLKFNSRARQVLPVPDGWKLGWKKVVKYTRRPTVSEGYIPICSLLSGCQVIGYLTGRGNHTLAYKEYKRRLQEKTSPVQSAKSIHYYKGSMIYARDESIGGKEFRTVEELKKWRRMLHVRKGEYGPAIHVWPHEVEGPHSCDHITIPVAYREDEIVHFNEYPITGLQKIGVLRVKVLG